MAKKTPVLVFVRHAHRDKPVPDKDNGLSAKGRSQVEDLLKDLKKEKLPQGDIFWSSPKLRCRETLQPLAQASHVPMKIEKLLDEQSFEESQRDFLNRIEVLIEKAQDQSGVVYLCSHGDLIPAAIDSLTGKCVDVSKGEAIVIRCEDGSWEIQ